MDKSKRRSPGRRPDAIDRARFLQLLVEAFPEVPQAFDESGRGLLHCEMGTFARLAQEAMDQGRFRQAARYFLFVGRVRRNAAPELENAIDVSFIEYLAFSEVTENRRHGVRKMPKVIRGILLEIDGRGRWV